MKIYQKFTDLTECQQPIHWAIGVFDGVHLGHQRVILSANTPGALRGVVTFRTHPLTFLKPVYAPLLLTPYPIQKYELLKKLKVDVVLELIFNPQLAAMTPTQFLDALCQNSHVAGISVGANWRFGKGGAGDARFLTTEAKRRGFNAVVCDLLSNNHATVCSTQIRQLLKDGHVKTAEAMLGRPFSVCGFVEHGQHLARQWGFPTANIEPSHLAALPKAGVYLVSAEIRGEIHWGIANIGIRPSISESTKIPRLEAHFPHWNKGDFYGQPLEIFLHDFLRPEIKFESLQELQNQIHKDLETAKPYINDNMPQLP